MESGAAVRMEDCDLTPFAPHMSEEMWEAYGLAEDLALTRWPGFDPELAREEEIEVAVQVNGKLRSRLFASPATDDDLRNKSLEDEKVLAATARQDVVRVIVIPRKLVNIVVQ
ncbi:MAG: class I tRNA ligase family protein [Acidobacteriota bacterium]